MRKEKNDILRGAIFVGHGVVEKLWCLSVYGYMVGEACHVRNYAYKYLLRRLDAFGYQI